MKLNEVLGTQKVQMVDRIINLLRSDDVDIINKTLDVLASVNISDIMDVPTMEHKLMTLETGDKRDNGNLARIYKKLEPMMKLEM